MLDTLAHSIFARRSRHRGKAPRRRPGFYPAHPLGRGARRPHQGRVGLLLRGSVAGRRVLRPAAGGISVLRPAACRRRARIAMGRAAAVAPFILPARQLLLEPVVEAATQCVDGRAALFALRGAVVVVLDGRFKILRVDFAQETARPRELHVAPFEPHFGIGERRGDLGAREGHIEEAPLLLEAVGRLHGALRGEKILFEAYDVDIFVFESLGRMDGHQGHLVAVFGVVLVHVGGEHDILQPLLDGGLLVGLPLAAPDFGVALLLEELHGVEQLLDVVQRRGGFGGILLPVSGQNARFRRDFETEVVEPLFGAGQRERPNHRHELRDLADDGLLHRVGRRFGHQGVDRLPHRDPALRGYLSDALDGRVADAARRIVDDAAESLVVARVDNQADITHQVADLLVVVERRTLVDAVGDAAAPQVLFQHERLVVGAVENRRLGPFVAGGPHAVAQVGDHRFGLFAVVVSPQHTDFLAPVAGRKTSLFQPFGIMLNYRICCINNRLCRTIILLQLKYLRSGKIFLKCQNIIDRSSTERIDRLRIVAHDADPRMILRKAPDNDILGIVGILILID